jgi:hypothetical protein
MADESLTHLDQRALRVRRDEAIDRMRYAAYGAFGSAGLAWLFILWIASDTGAWGPVPSVGVGPASQALVAYSLLERRKPLDAWLLLAALVFTAAYRWVAAGRPSGLLVFGGLAFLYLNGLRGALDYPEVDAELARRAAASAGPPSPVGAAG